MFCLFNRNKTVSIPHRYSNNLTGFVSKSFAEGDPAKIGDPKIEGPKIEDIQKDTVSTEGESITAFIQRLKVLAGNLAFFQVPYLARTVMLSLAIYNEQFVFECSRRILEEMFNLSPSNKARVYSIIKSLPGTRIIRSKTGNIVDLTGFVSKSFAEGDPAKIGDPNLEEPKIGGAVSSSRFQFLIGTE